MASINFRNFNSDEVAKIDTRMWRAYYQHKFGKLTVLLIVLMHRQFDLGWHKAIKAANYSARAAFHFRKTKDYDRTLKDLIAFYSYISVGSTETFDPVKVADLELRWWLIHRHPNKYHQSLEDALAAAMSALYQVNPASMREYAKYRAKAMHVRDVATWQTKTEPDWDEIESLLQKAYRALKLKV